MEQISFDTSYAISSNVHRVKTALEAEILNPEATKYLDVVLNKDKTISINAKTGLTAKIKIGKKVSFVEIKEQYVKHFKGCVVKYPASRAPRIMISSFNEVFSYIKQLAVVYSEVLTEQAGEHYGCCHRYVECSDALKCLNPDYLMSLACGYKGNLEAGRVFYGKNTNIN